MEVEEQKEERRGTDECLVFSIVLGIIHLFFVVL